MICKFNLFNSRACIFSLCLYVIFTFANYSAKAQNLSLNYPINEFVTSAQNIELCWNYNVGYFYEIEVATDQNFSNIFFTSTNLSNRKIIVNNLFANTTYYWRVRIASPYVSAWSPSRKFTRFLPNAFSSLGLWLRADTAITLSNGTIVNWKDLSTNQYSLTQTNTANQPTLTQNYCNNNNSVKFDGNDYFVIPNYVFGINNTVFTVVQRNGGLTQSRFVGASGNNLEITCDQTGWVQMGSVAFYDTYQPTLLTVTRASGNNSVYKNDSIIGASGANLSPISNASLYLGWSAFQNPVDFLVGEIAEIIIYSDLLNDSLIDVVNKYLMDKYSENLDLGPDTIINDNFCPVQLSASFPFEKYLWSTGDTTATTSVNSSGSYWLQARDYFGRLKYDTIQVQFPAFNQLLSQPICLGAQLNWNTGLNNNFTTLWQNNSTSNQFNIDTSGAFYFVATDNFGCTFYSDTANILLDNFSVSETLGNDTSLCAGNTIQLQNYISNNANYLWSNGSNYDSLVISNSGIYWVEVSNQNNCILRDSINVIIIGIAPNAAFSALNGCIGSAVNFTDLSTPPMGETISQWLWDFGDGTTSNLQNNVHIFDSAGLYNASLKVVSQSGCGAIFNQNLTVFETPLLSYTAINLCNEKLTEFNNTSNLFGGSLQSVGWNYGDASSATNTASSTPAFHNYSDFGDYTISLTIQTTEGCVDSAQWLINIKPSPVADFNSSKICIGDSTVFTDISYIPFPWQNIHREWLFPNGDTSFAYQPMYNFSSAGNYQVTLNMQSSNGCRDTVIKEITIFNKPIANLTFEKSCIGEAAVLSDSSSCNNCSITNYYWSINNNLIGNAPNVNYLFTDTGSYAVTLFVENNAGCNSVIDTILNINTPPTANFTINSNFGSPPFTGEFINLSANATYYLWQFGDGSFSQNLNPSHTFNDTGSFNIVLNAYNDNDCVSKYNQVLQLKPKNIDLVIFNLETDLVNEFTENTLVVFNKSTTIITGFEIIISNKTNAVIKEIYDNSILPGEFKTIKLNTKIKQGEGLNLTDVMCVEIININEGLDSDISNNSKCNTISTNEFKLLNLYPNPTLDDIYLNFICPLKDVITVEITDASGNIVKSQKFNVSVGYNEFHIPTLGLAAGSYYCNVNYNNNIQSKSFLKLSK
jgi:PKD repeat protein